MRLRLEVRSPPDPGARRGSSPAGAAAAALATATVAAATAAVVAAAPVTAAAAIVAAAGAALRPVVVRRAVGAAHRTGRADIHRRLDGVVEAGAGPERDAVAFRRDDQRLAGI